MTRRRLLLLVVVVTLAALAVAAGVVLLAGDDDRDSTAATAADTDVSEGEGAGGLDRCVALAEEPARTCYTEELKALVNGAGDPGAALGEIAVAAYRPRTGSCSPTATDLCTRSGGNTRPPTASRSGA